MVSTSWRREKPTIETMALQWIPCTRVRIRWGGRTGRELLNLYRANSHQLVEEILSGKGRGDMVSVASSAHKLAGAAGSIGCAALDNQARYVQEIAESGNIETLGDALSRLTEIQNKSLLALDAVIGEAGPSATSP